MEPERRKIALCTSRVFDMENHRFITSLNNALVKENCSLLIYHINADQYWLDDKIDAATTVFELIDYEKTDVVIWMDERIKSKKLSQKVISKARQHHVPVIVVDAAYEDCVSVCFDYEAGFEKVVRHVMSAHHVKKPHYMAGIPGNSFSENRLAVFQKVLREYGIPYDDSMISYGLYWAKPTIEETEKLIASKNLPDAIICANDIMAINVSNVLQQHGFAVPGDVIVTGFDGIDEINFVTPKITSADCGGSELAAEVFRAIQACLADPGHTAQYFVEPKLLLNASCGCPHAAQTDQIHNFNDKFYRYQDDNQLLYEISERMQACHSLAEASYCLFCDQIQDMSFVINQWCTDHTVNHFETPKEADFDDTMYLFFDTDVHTPTQCAIRRTDMIPNLEHVMERGYPLIFNAVSFMRIPLGYLCFHFQDYDLTNYCKIPQIVNTLSSGLGSFINRQYQRYLLEQLSYIYQYDAMTGLFNRTSFSREFAKLKAQLDGHPIPLTVLLSDLDNLKYINDHFGHTAGDHAIRTVADALRTACPADAICVRFGGDEMLAVIPGQSNAEEITAAIHTYLHAYNESSGLEYSVAASVGARVTVLDMHTSFEQIIKEADAAMYAEKQQRKQK